MDNMDIFNRARQVPAEYKKNFNNGKFSGTDISPMWRIEKLTELFGACGFGWYYTIDRLWAETMANDEVASHAQISLYVKMGGEWSKPIVGVGGNIVTKATKDRLVNSDECYKMALTDALSVATKSLGIGADVYYGDKTKYTKAEPKAKEVAEVDVEPKSMSASQRRVRAVAIMNEGIRSESEPRVIIGQVCEACEIPTDYAADIIKKYVPNGKANQLNGKQLVSVINEMVAA